MWIQYWTPLDHRKYAIWQEDVAMYWGFTRSRNPNVTFVTHWIAWWRSRRLAEGRTFLTIQDEDVLNRGDQSFATKNELDELWRQIMRDPTTFMIKQSL